MRPREILHAAMRELTDTSDIVDLVSVVPSFLAILFRCKWVYVYLCKAIIDTE